MIGLRSGLGASGVDLETLVTRRPRGLFADDLAARRPEILTRIEGQRLLVVGGAGSIGAATVARLLDYRPAALHVVDQNENDLVELVRDLRGGVAELGGTDVRTLPLDYGSPVMARLLREEGRYDVVLNFAAVKHVRSEKDVYSALQMLDTNIVRHARFKQWLAEHRHGATYFAVSTDKAANPVSLMGASKRLMEDLIFGVGAGHSRSTTSARFANVAFSNGSLLQGWLYRLTKRQPVAVPRETRRYFLSHGEAAALCVLATASIPDRHIAVPRLEPALALESLETVAARFLEAHGLTPVPTTDEAQARRDVDALAATGRWPLLLTPRDTTGEKPYEEFVGEGETAHECGLAAVLALPHVPSPARERGLFDRLQALASDPSLAIDRDALIRSVAEALPGFRHVESDHHLDQRL